MGKGIVKGLSGLIFKPVAGVLDLTSKTSEGIKN
jgi:vacuolar protein sorting-associated protein 13A/C